MYLVKITNSNGTNNYVAQTASAASFIFKLAIKQEDTIEAQIIDGLLGGDALFAWDNKIGMYRQISVFAGM